MLAECACEWVNERHFIKHNVEPCQDTKKCAISMWIIAIYDQYHMSLLVSFLLVCLIPNTILSLPVSGIVVPGEVGMLY